MPELGPFGETFFEADDLAMVAASFVNKRLAVGGCVESVVTFATQRLDDFLFARGALNLFKS